MKILGARELMDATQATASARMRQSPPMRELARARAAMPRTGGRKLIGGFVALGVQGLFLAGLVYGTMYEPTPAVENLTVVNILDEAPLMEDLPPPPAPTFEQPVIHLQAPLVTISEPEPTPRAPTAIVSSTPTPAPIRMSDEERNRVIADFQRSLQRHLIRHMRYPPGARSRREEGIVHVRVAMDRRGYVLSARVQDASDFPQLNEESLAVVTRAQPLPVPPSVVAGDPVDLIIPVTFSLRMHGRGGRRAD